MNWARRALRHKHPSVLQAATTALEVLDSLVAMSSSLDRQHTRMLDGKMYDKVRGLSSDAAAVALDPNQVQKAVELSEQGRGILLAQLVRYRDALDDLRAASPRIADELMELSSQLEHSVHRESANTMHGKLGTSGLDIVGRYVNIPSTKNLCISPRGVFPILHLDIRTFSSLEQCCQPSTGLRWVQHLPAPDSVRASKPCSR